jgi:hypothetical protein
LRLLAVAAALSGVVSGIPALVKPPPEMAVLARPEPISRAQSGPKRAERSAG